MLYNNIEDKDIKDNTYTPILVVEVYAYVCTR